VSYRRSKPNSLEVNRRKQWLLEHGDQLGALGLPLRVFETWERWEEFLEMGCLDRFEDSTHFSFEQLSPATQGRLLAFLDEHYHHGDPPSLLRWLRVRLGEDWPFDQARNVAAVSDASVVDDRAAVLLVVHYSEDDSWGFFSGEPFIPERGKVISMGEVLEIDPTLRTVADLPPGWTARRQHVGDSWAREADPDL
jgi:hypothetical protein